MNIHDRYKNCEKHDLGTFAVESGTLIVSDPCYKLGTWCHGTLKNAEPGLWRAFAYVSDEGEWGHRVAALMAVHENATHDSALTECQAEFCVGVDSGQAGIFELVHYRDDNLAGGSTGEHGEAWYGACCAQTLKPVPRAGTIPYGAVSSSGYGDGAYSCFYYTNGSGSIVKVIIDFDLWDDEEEAE